MLLAAWPLWTRRKRRNGPTSRSAEAVRAKLLRLVRKMIRDHHSELERQIKARGRQRNHQAEGGADDPRSRIKHMQVLLYIYT